MSATLYAIEAAQVQRLLSHLRTGTRKPQYSLQKLRGLWSPFRSCFSPRPRIAHQYSPTPEDIDAVLPWVSDERFILRQCALLALREADALADLTCPIFLTALRDPHPLVRITAADALRHYRPPTAAPALVAALDDPTWRVRWHAAEALLRAAKPSGTAAALEASAPRRFDPGWLDAVRCLPVLTPGILTALIRYRDAVTDPWVQAHHRPAIEALLATRPAP